LEIIPNFQLGKLLGASVRDDGVCFRGDSLGVSERIPVCGCVGEERWSFAVDVKDSGEGRGYYYPFYFAIWACSC